MLSLLPENERPTGQDVKSKERLSIKKVKQATNNMEFKSIKSVRLEDAKLWTTSNKFKPSQSTNRSGSDRIRNSTRQSYI